MHRTRVIPCLLLRKDGLVKTQKFDRPNYLGDPRNIIKIFNEKGADELIVLDILATKAGQSPNFDFIAEMVSEAFMPVGYGGGIRSIEDIRRLLRIGIEKISINTMAIENPAFVREASGLFGSQSIIVSIDVKRDIFGKYRVYSGNGRKNTKIDPVEFAKKMQDYGAGELLVNSIEKDGMMQGYDWGLIKMISEAISIPVVACGGAGSMDDFQKAVFECGASAVAAGSYFVYQGIHKAVLITYPDENELSKYKLI